MSEISAYHEAGHAFMAVYVGARVRSVTIAPDWDDGPDRHADIQVEWPVNQYAERELLEKMVMVALAGPVAEIIHSGELDAALLAKLREIKEPLLGKGR